MTYELDPTGPVPLYQQLVGRLRRLIALGALGPGERLPTVRELAVRARVNRNTAARAIQELEREGLVRTRVGQGSFVADGGIAVDREARAAILDRRLDDLVAEAEALGLPLGELPERLRRRIEVREEGAEP
jgi:GntR family transcriptional regulator